MKKGEKGEWGVSEGEEKDEPAEEAGHLVLRGRPAQVSHDPLLLGDIGDDCVNHRQFYEDNWTETILQENSELIFISWTFSMQVN